ncbi:uncharacterized protein LOC129574695 [Sitodiplosis mosellana]|uniref:uncharacterized protein LOC129574695 n=1 Tax=Sitodiplosis mosellana TaxID=263140 RepID=UPI002443948D|nr:uncharacterized protein LOC129574695 [Sitodiplosis mosellana]XP_055313036.1 uncharacterized protein LOC129574695 [Sitodiplosis mosellana]XP_055313037.1 uncharacterized protein LOC129574695 [Sitodiplosis mosellana]XP_055313038.1 uncharacterized protein LOC129574695 [Sitodiplosis mosellana]
MDAVKTNKSSELNSNVENADEHEWRWKPWSIVRSDYQRMAWEADRSGVYDKAILYDSMALSCGFISTMLNNDQQPLFSDNRPNASKIEHPLQRSSDLQRETKNILIDYLSEYLSHVVIGEPKKIPHDKDKNHFDALRSKCAQLPKQWNVVQFNQVYSGYNGFATTKDVYTSDAPIKITLFCDSLSKKRDNRPISIVLDFIELGEKSILSTAHEVHQVLYENYLSYMNTLPTKYSEFMKRLKQTQLKLVADMATWLGPWITLLSGKIKGKAGEDFEQKIFEDVDKFAGELGWMTPDQVILLSLMARRIDLLDNGKIEQAARDIAPSYKDSCRIEKFLLELKAKTPFKDFTYYPCILVIDEILDQMPWEMVLTSQEFTRVHSIYLLFDLYERYKDQIDDGYLKMSIKNGFSMINPNNDDKLNDMCKRMTQFYDNCLPNWERIERIVPSAEKISECLSKNELFVYSGHGSSLNFFSNFELESMRHNCLMLLFGCDSIATKPSGTISEAACSSYTYFKNGCPGTLGAITIVTDVWVDLITIWILTQWIVPKQMTHPKIKVCKDARSKEHVSRILLKSEGKRNPNLLAILCDLRNETEITFGMRSAIVYRGLPPYNTLAEK